MRGWGCASAASAALLLFSVTPAAAHGPTPQKVEEKITISAEPDAVWAVIKDFDSLAKWNSLVVSSTGKGGNEAGAEREVVLKSGAKLVDGLDEYRGDEKTYSYRLATPDIEKFPVSFYSASIAVLPGDGGGSQVEWISRLYRADTGNFPPEEKNDAAAIAAMTDFIKSGLEGIKKAAEAK